MCVIVHLSLPLSDSRPSPSPGGQLRGPHGHVPRQPLLGGRGQRHQRPALPPAARHQCRHHQRGAHRPAAELPERVQRRHRHFQQVRETRQGSCCCREIELLFMWSIRHCIFWSLDPSFILSRSRIKNVIVSFSKSKAFIVF